MHNVIVRLPNVPEEEQNGKYLIRIINFKKRAIPLGQKTEVDDSMFSYLTEMVPTPQRRVKKDGTADIVDVMKPRFSVIEV